MRNVFLRASAVVALIGMPAIGLRAAQAEPVPARSAAAFVDSVGVNVHWAYGNVYTRRRSELFARLKELGVRHVRDGAIPAVYPAARELFQKHGIATTFITGKRKGGHPAPLDSMLIPTELRELKAGALEACAAIEGPNEYDIMHDARETDWAAAARDYQQKLAAAVRADPDLKKKTLLAPSLTSTEAYRKVGDLSAYCDVANIHPYRSSRHPDTAAWGGDGYGNLERALLPQAAVQAPGKPIQATETGYSQGRGDNRYLPEAVDARYTLRLYTEFFRRGIARTFKYEFVDQGQELTRNKEGALVENRDGEGRFGLIANDLRPKPAFLALKNLLTLLRETPPAPGAAAAFRPASLDFTLEGAPADVRSVLLQKRDGDFYLLLWREAPSADPDTRVQFDVPVAPVTLVLPVTSVRSVAVALPENAALWSRREMRDGRLGLAVSDAVMLVRLSAKDAPPAR